jgi:hypothetical protein
VHEVVQLDPAVVETQVQPHPDLALQETESGKELQRFSHLLLTKKQLDWAEQVALSVMAPQSSAQELPTKSQLTLEVQLS